MQRERDGCKRTQNHSGLSQHPTDDRLEIRIDLLFEPLETRIDLREPPIDPLLETFDAMVDAGQSIGNLHIRAFQARHLYFQGLCAQAGLLLAILSHLERR